MELIELCKTVKQASTKLMSASTREKNKVLETIAQTLETHIPEILAANQKDLENGKAQGMKEGLLDRMTLSEERMLQIIDGVRQVKDLQDPIGEITNMKVSPNGLQIGQMRVALGVVAMIYEARPNVSVDAAVLCLKTGNAVLLRGSKDILTSNQVLVQLMQDALRACDFDPHCITLLEDTSRETSNALMKMNDYIDVLIPRGGAGLIKACVENASVPVLETGTGNCHVYVDEQADLDKALAIILNAKTTRTSVCNACESVLFHQSLPDTFYQRVISSLIEAGVVIHADAYLCRLDDRLLLATEEDYAKEYLDLELSMCRVENVTHAIHHINTYSTHHSEAIISTSYDAIQHFIKEVDSACVYANASTRFSDGFEFGLGAEIGISTQKLHARGPMGLLALTTLKYIILGDGQIR